MATALAVDYNRVRHSDLLRLKFIWDFINQNQHSQETY